MEFTLHVWRQPRPHAKGRFVVYHATAISPHQSFLEMLDVVNERLIDDGDEPIAFDHDCREGICGSCGMVINGVPHGPHRSTATCQLHMRSFRDGEDIFIEPWRAKAFPVIRDLVVDRSAFDRIIAAGGFISARTGSAPEANTTRIPRPSAERALDAAACIGCGACVAACPNASAMLFVSAKASHLGLLPQGQPERYSRVRAMVAAMDREHFGNCTNHGACEVVCPVDISLDFIARLNQDYLRATLAPSRKGEEA